MSSRTSGSGFLAHVAGHERHGDVVADRQRRADAQSAGVGLVGQRGLELVRFVPYGFGARTQGAAQLAQLQALADAIEEPDVELSLEVGE